MPSRPFPTIAPRLADMFVSRPARILAWGLLIGATGLLVRAEVSEPEVPPGVRLTSDLVYQESGLTRRRLDVYLPESPPPAGGYPVLVAIHGGGWRGGSKGDFGRSLVPLVRAGVAVVAVDYRLSRPGSPSWPENCGDLLAALAWVGRHAEEFQLNPRKTALIGASAGGHLALCVGNRVTERQASRSVGDAMGPVRVRAVIDFYGPTDLGRLRIDSPAAADPVETLLGGRPEAMPDRYRAASPLNMIGPTSPPVLIFHGTDDRLVPIEQSLALEEALRRADVPHRLIRVVGARHGFSLKAHTDLGTKDFVRDVLEFLESSWKD